MMSDPSPLSITWENVPRGRCVVCSSELKDRGFFYCLRCGGVAEIEFHPLGGGPKMIQINPVLFLADARSKCCGAELEVRTRITCSDKCHRLFVRVLISQFGEFKRLVDQSTGKSYRVPTKEIIEKGLKWRDLTRYPEWSTKQQEEDSPNDFSNDFLH
ncbi:hypothetical protein [Methanocella conradii]|uniref:hypothetical protein n=1 Tax=Methanocella conradii TaxID=1175444 RepID=UPI00157D5E04|nr:hypothetical protein [Methanocella conradii]